MTELETLERARMYLEKLANGIDPIDGSQIPDGDVVNNVRLRRCFFYVADVLRQVIENGGISGEKERKEKKRPFSLPPGKRGAFAFSPQPVTISELSGRINDLNADENMTKLPYRAIRDWLAELAMLQETVNSEGKTTRHPTPLGESIGIALESRTGQNGTYFVVVYGLEAQHFILDHLDEIVECERDRTKNQGQPWLPEHDACLRELYAQGVPVQTMAGTLKRDSGSVRKRLKKLGLTE